jgi:hypothetical protein
MKTKRVIIAICAFIMAFNISNAQFADFNNYPVTVTPHESADSTRGHFWGYMFGSYYTKLHADSVNHNVSTQYAILPKGSNAFSLQRLYLGYDYFFNKQFSVHAVLASEDNADNYYTGAPTIDPKENRGVYVKYANLEWANFFNSGLKFSVGAITTPSFAITEEPFWGYRSIDRTIMDMKGITSSNDFGVSIGGKIWSKKDDMGIENACVGFNFMIGNSTGAVPDVYNLPSYTVWHKYYGDIYVKALGDKLVLDLYGDGHTYNWAQVEGQAHDMHQYEITGRVFLGYKAKNFNVSVSYFQQTQYNMLSQQSGTAGSGVPVQGDTVNNVQSGLSIMGAVVLMRDKSTSAPKLSLIARYDMFNPCVNYNPNITYLSGGMYVNGVDYELQNSVTESYFVFGFDYQPIKQIHFMPNIWYDGIADREYNTTPVATPATPIQKFDYDMVVRLTFYYQFFKN